MKLHVLLSRRRLAAALSTVLLGCGAATSSGGGATADANTAGDAAMADATDPDGASEDGAGADATAAVGDAAKPDGAAVDVAKDAAKSDAKGDAASETAGAVDATEAPDAAAEVVVAAPGTVAAIQQDEGSQNCPPGQPFSISASGVVVEPLVATSAGVKVTGSGTSSATSFFAQSKDNATADGAWSGIQVVVNANPFVVKPGDVLQITASAEEIDCNTELVALPAAVAITGSVVAPEPFLLQMVDLAGANAEPFEGDLVRVKNVQVSDPNPKGGDGKTHGYFAIDQNGGKITVLVLPAANSLYSTTGKFGPATTFGTGQTFQSVTGNLQWTPAGWLLRIRSDSDLVMN